LSCPVPSYIMRISPASWFALAGAATVSALPAQNQGGSDGSDNPSFRFVFEWSQEMVLNNPDGFINDLLYWEGQFHQNNVSYNTENGMSYDGTQLDWVTGQRTDKNTFSAASKEARRDSTELSIGSVADSSIGPSDNALHPCHRRLSASCTILDSQSPRGCSGFCGFYPGVEASNISPVQ
jgi:hypothetical protein